MEKKNGSRIQIEILTPETAEEYIHENAVLLFVLEGELNLVIDEYQIVLPRESIYIVNAGKRYSYRGNGKILLAVFHLPDTLIRSMTQNLEVVFWCNSTVDDNEKYNVLRAVLRRLLSRYMSTQKRGMEFGYLSLCFQLLEELTTNFMLRISDREQMDDNTQFEERLMQINQYINNNYNQPISSKELADQLFLSQGYLSRFFKRNYGMSFAEYLTSVRLYHAVEDLTYTSMPITRIAYDNGFSNVAALNKAFKDKYGNTPTALRKKMQSSAEKQEELKTSDAARGRLENYLRAEGPDMEDKGNLSSLTASCSVKNSTLLKTIWQDTVNIGSASDLLKSEVREHVLLLKDILQIKYIRFWNLFSQEMLIAPVQEGGSYNFSKLDAILDFLTDNGLYPHIELGMKPKRLYRNVQNAIVEEKVETSSIMLQIEYFVYCMMKHLHHRYKRSELRYWRLEYWFDEDMRSVEGAVDNYFSQFSNIYKTVRQFSESMQVGGCGLRGRYEEGQWINSEFLMRWNEQDVKPDFISSTFFGYERGSINQDRYSKRSTDEEAFLHDAEHIREAMVQAGMSSIPLYITEWNLTKSDRNYINDSCFKGAYIMKNILDVYDVADMASFFVGSDRVAEYYDSEGSMFGGSGLVTRQGIIKPAGYAFRFLKWLYGYYVGRGRNYLVTTDRHDDYAVVFHNQKTLNYNYYLSKEDELEKENIWKYFEDRDSLQLKLNLSDVQNGTYQVKIYRINGQNGSPLAKWGELGYQTELSRNDVKYLQRVCGPALSITSTEVKDGILSLEIMIAANEIGFVRIRKV